MKPIQRRYEGIKKTTGSAAIAVVLCLSTAALTVQASRHNPATEARTSTEQLQPGRTPNAIDIGFLQSMHLHHAQAVQMAMLVRHSAQQLEIRGLADAIFVGQTHEMGLMKGWLTAWGAPVLSTSEAMVWVEYAEKLNSADDVLYVSRCRSQGGQMEGLASPEDIKRLGALRGSAQEKLFLNLMVKHHQAALDMANFARRHGRSELVKGFAHTLAKEQLNEIGWMQNRLAS